MESIRGPRGREKLQCLAEPFYMGIDKKYNPLNKETFPCQRNDAI